MTFTARRLRGHWAVLALFVLFTALGVVFTVATALSVADFLKLLFDPTATAGGAAPMQGNLVAKALNALYNWLIVYGVKRALFYFSLFVMVTYSLKNLFCYLAAITMARLRISVVREIRDDMYAKLLRLPMGYFVRNRKGDVLARFAGDIVEYDEGIMTPLQTITNAILSMVVYMTVLFNINVKLTLLVLCMLPVMIFVVGGLSRRLKRTSVEMQERGADLMSQMEETMMGVKIIKSYTAIDFSNRRFNKMNRAYTKLRVGVFRRIDMASPVSDFLGNVIVIGILMVGSVLIMNHDQGLTPELFISFITLFVLMLPPSKDMTTALAQFKKGRACEDRLQGLLDEEEESVGGDKVFDGLKESIEFNHLSFSYSGTGDEKVLDDICLKIEKGRRVALVGSSGSGKSTLVGLLGRYYEAPQGQLLLDGVPCEHYTVASLRAHIGEVSQDTVLFNDTIAANIAFGSPQATRQEIVEAARIANVHDFIMALPLGYDTRIGDGGETLSGGQRQRLSIARMVLRRPEIVVMDEATSALDTETERQVQAALDAVMEGRTAIVIAHRLSTVVGMDEIVVLEHGRIVERGSHRELMALGGRYRQLVELQKTSVDKSE